MLHQTAERKKKCPLKPINFRTNSIECKNSFLKFHKLHTIRQDDKTSFFLYELLNFLFYFEVGLQWSLEHILFFLKKKKESKMMYCLLLLLKILKKKKSQFK